MCAVCNILVEPDPETNDRHLVFFLVPFTKTKNLVKHDKYDHWIN